MDIDKELRTYRDNLERAAEKAVVANAELDRLRGAGGILIRRAAREKGLRCAYVCKKLGVHTTSLWRWAKERPSLEHIRAALALLLGGE